jgi:hypothetical protein
VIAPELDTQADVEICLGEGEQMVFVKGGSGTVGGLLSEETRTSDTADHECMLDALPELEEF